MRVATSGCSDQRVIDHINFLITQRLDLEHGGSIDVGLMHELATDREAPGHRDQPTLF